MTHCRFENYNLGTKCSECGYAIPEKFAGQKLFHECDKHPHPHAQPSGLGDKTEKLLAFFGVTQKRYLRLKVYLGLSSYCNCKKRKAWLNTVPAACVKYIWGVVKTAWRWLWA